MDPTFRAVPIGTEIVLEVDNIGGELDRLVNAGVDLATDLQRRPWGLDGFRLSDPDGCYYRFTSRR